jgi:hypothetical protein
MRQIITVRPISNGVELNEFQAEIQMLTLGCNLTRCISYSTFRQKVLQCHQTGIGMHLKCFLSHNHVVTAEEGVATLYRHIQEGDDTNAEFSIEGDDESSCENAKKRRGPKKALCV